MADAALYPYVIEPKLTAAIWGGDALVRRFGKAGDPTATLGESWECWDENTVANGSLRGWTIAQLRADLGGALMGDLDAGRMFPVLTKIIDARAALSVQVHPGDAYAQRVERQPNGKTECWYVLDAKPGADLILGWNRAASREEYERRVADGTLGDILRRVPVSAGESYYLPAGTLHAIGAGIIVYETQQASDLTYRIFDWNRIGTDGKPRELHVRKAGDVLDYAEARAGAVRPIEYELESVHRTALIADDHFSVERVGVRTPAARISTAGRPLIASALDTAVTLHCSGGEAALAPYQTALIPAAAEQVELRAQDTTDVMLVTPHRGAGEFAARLKAAGLTHGRIDEFLSQFRARVSSITETPMIL